MSTPVKRPAPPTTPAAPKKAKRDRVPELEQVLLYKYIEMYDAERAARLRLVSQLTDLEDRNARLYEQAVTAAQFLMEEEDNVERITTERNQIRALALDLANALPASRRRPFADRVFFEPLANGQQFPDSDSETESE